MASMDQIQKDLENNLRLSVFQYVIEVGGFENAVREFYEDVKACGQENEFYFQRFFEEAREKGYLL